MKRYSNPLSRIMSYRLPIIAFLACMAISLSSGVCSNNRGLFPVEKGNLDLAEWKWGQEEPVRLDGSWEFYWKRLLAPQDFSGPAGQVRKDYFPIPGLWRGTLTDGQDLTSKGYATYRMIVTGLPQNELYALHISDILSVGSIWINGRLLASSGQTGQIKKEERPETHSITAGFTHMADKLEIVIQVSNFHNSQGGINTGIWLGTDHQIRQMVMRRWLITGSLGCALMLLGLCHLAFFGIRRKEPVNLYFGLYCMFWALQTFFGVNGECLMAQLFPGLPWRLSIDMTLLSYGFTTPLMIMFYHELFPNPLSRQINRVYQILGGLFMAYLLFTPPNAFDPKILIFALVSLSAFGYLFVLFIRDITGRKKSNFLLIPGYLVLILTGANDVLHDLHIIETTFLIRYGIFFFILSYSFLISARFSMAFSAIEDLTLKLKEKNIELSKLDRLKDNFLAVISHELRTPLSGIIRISQSLMEQQNSRRLSLIISSASRILSLINDLLDFSKLKDKGLKLQIQPLYINPLIDPIIMVVKKLSENKPLSIENKVPGSFPMVLADENRFSQILFNLLGNAVKYTDRGEITVEAVLKDQWVKISVRDTGIGIPKDKLNTIFQRFEQVDHSVSGKYTGTGLGLSIARELVILHGGDIGVESNENRGSDFWFTLKPASGSDMPTEEIPQASRERVADIPADPVSFPPPVLLFEEKNPNGRNALILAVDDDPVNLEVITGFLCDCDFRVIPCHSSAMALEHIEKRDIPDLILLDAMMPGMSGYDVCRKIRETYSALVLPIIILTAGKQVQDLFEEFDSGANDYLTTPFLKDELRARVHTQLQLKKSSETMKENLALKKELELREKQEMSLRLTQQRLLRMLDKIEDAVLAVNPASEIIFCNHRFETLSGYPAKNVLGRSVTELLSDMIADDDIGLLSTLKGKNAHQGEKYYPDLEITKAGQKDTIRVDICISFLDQEGGALGFLILKKSCQDPVRLNSIGESAEIIRAINNSHERLEQLDMMIERASPGSDDSQSQEKKENLKAVNDIQAARRRLSVKVLNLSCDLWTMSTKLSKLELAEKSGLWSIYIEKDGWARTQTLDKYLKEKTLPVRPRWRSILHTADFVLELCETPLPLRNELEHALDRLKSLM